MNNSKNYKVRVLCLVLLSLCLIAWSFWPATKASWATQPVEASSRAAGVQERIGLDPARQSQLKALYSQLKAGAAFSKEERRVLLRFINEEAITSIEADTVTSRALFARYVSGQKLSKQQKRLLRLYEESAAAEGRAIADAAEAEPAEAAASCNNYSVTSATGFTVAAASTDTGNHCEDCTTAITLPFAYTLYDQAFTTANVSANGVLEFGSNSAEFTNTALPAAGFSYSIFPYWDDLCTGTDCGDAHTGSITNGILTSVSGSAPNRTFDIVWQASYSSNPAQVARFQVRLYEGQLKFDVVFGQIDQGGAVATVGVQRDSTCFTQFSFGTNSVAAGQKLTFTAAQACTLTCPGDKTVGTSSETHSGENVDYTLPTTSGNCGAVICSPASGSFFPIGSTTVNCSEPGGASCSFKVTVVEGCSLICPSNRTVNESLGQGGAFVDYPVAVGVGFCSRGICSPPPGSFFPVGTTTVNCTSGGPVGFCSFTITVQPVSTFDLCLQDESNGNTLLFNSSTGDYQFCASGIVVSGRGSITAKGCYVTLQVNEADRRMLARIDKCGSVGSVTLQLFSLNKTLYITDKDTRNDTCTCGKQT